MAQRSEEIEAALAYVQDLVTAYYVVAAKEACEVTKDDPAVARLKTAEQLARSGRYLKLFRETGRRAVAAITALPSRPVSPETVETPMNDRPEWTAERIAELHAEVRRRMAKLLDDRETKRMAGDSPAGADRGLSAESETDRTPPGPPA
ncbi:MULTISPECIES: hypothetical protein [unclassified Caulobacter]|uniref:hypothetical protein n=1 Tax=unclassified Caulobacter TaxID=2648921 RepID=UPI001E4DAA02|nr:MULTISPECIES: hypothetical protein [unclassified Caulobacter]